MWLRPFIDALSGRDLDDDETQVLLDRLAVVLYFFALVTFAQVVVEHRSPRAAHLFVGVLVYVALAVKIAQTGSRALACLVGLLGLGGMYEVATWDRTHDVALGSAKTMILTLWNMIELLLAAAAVRVTFALQRRRRTAVVWGSLVGPLILLIAWVLATVLLIAVVPLPSSQAHVGGAVLEAVVFLGLIVRVIPRIELVSREPARPAPSRRIPSADAKTVAAPRPARNRPPPTARRPLGPTVPKAVPQPAAEPNPWVGRVLGGKLAIERVAGKGGTGTVYRATHVELGTPMAVKIVPRRHDLQSERFLREGRLASSIPSDRVVRVFDCVEADTILYLTMEWIEGGTLAEQLAAEGSLPVDEACRVIDDILDALSAAHGLGIVHRDVKPANVMRSPRGALLADFGIARDQNAATLTREGTMLGTPAYVSPEQVLGEALDPRSDLYSVGVVLFEMLTGRLPFAASNPLALMMARLDEQPEPLDRALPGAPPRLVAIVARALARDRERRFPSAMEMQRAIVSFRESSAISSAGYGSAPTTR